MNNYLTGLAEKMRLKMDSSKITVKLTAASVIMKKGRTCWFRTSGQDELRRSGYAEQVIFSPANSEIYRNFAVQSYQSAIIADGQSQKVHISDLPVT